MRSLEYLRGIVHSLTTSPLGKEEEIHLIMMQDLRPLETAKSVVPGTRPNGTALSLVLINVSALLRSNIITLNTHRRALLQQSECTYTSNYITGLKASKLVILPTAKPRVARGKALLRVQIHEDGELVQA